MLDLRLNPKLYGVLVLWAQYNEFVESGLKNCTLMSWIMTNMDVEDD